VIDQYVPLALLLGVVVVVAAVLVVLAITLGPSRPTAAKVSAFECGVIPVGDARTRFPVRYYLVALVFVVFDLEAVFIYPWAVSLPEMRALGLTTFWFVEMLVFMGVLLVGLVYLWKRGALDWE
jgi:NADH-quinone oxidoreductase subunit A